MATRASLARNTAPKEVYEGRVHKWERRWLVHKKGTIKTEAMLELLRWIVTDERCPDLTGPRHPHIKPVKRPIIKQPSKKTAEQAGEDAGGPRSGADEQQAAPQPPAQQAAETAAAEQSLAERPAGTSQGPATTSGERVSEPADGQAVAQELLQQPLQGDVIIEELAVSNGDARAHGDALHDADEGAPPQPQETGSGGAAAAQGSTQLPDAEAGGQGGAPHTVAALADGEAGAAAEGPAMAAEGPAMAAEGPAMAAEGPAHEAGGEQALGAQDVEMEESGVAS